MYPKSRRAGGDYRSEEPPEDSGATEGEQEPASLGDEPGAQGGDEPGSAGTSAKSRRWAYRRPPREEHVPLPLPLEDAPPAG
jgi:hypothetical protein